jgi:hypothetical protein
MNPAYINSIQQIINILFSEEMLAFETYKLMRYNLPVVSKIKEFTSLIDDIEVIATDEYDDHAKKIVKFCEMFGFSYPKTNQEFKRFASESSVTAFESGTQHDTIESIASAIYQLELDAINSYARAIAKLDETLNVINVQGNFDLISDFLRLLENNLKDEQEHAEMMLILLNHHGVPTGI